MITALILANALTQSAPLAGPQPYPVTAEQRRREEQWAAAGPSGGFPPRIGMTASWRNNPGGMLVIGYAESPGGRWITEIYSMDTGTRDPSAPPILFVRRAQDSYQAQEQIRWVDSRTCPGLVETLLQANDLPLPFLILPLDEASRTRVREAVYPPPPAPDGGGPHEFWASARGGVANDLQFSAHAGPWVEWADAVGRVLEPCWQEERPVNPPRDWD